MKLTSSAFVDGGRIPQTYTCDGDRLLSPPLAISDIPEEAGSLVLIVDDPDVPKALLPEGHFVHWVLFNIPQSTSSIPEGGSAGIAGVNGRGEKNYTGPCPPPDHEPTTHRYIFTLFALDTRLNLAEGSSKEEVESAMEGHVLETVDLIGTYSRA
jgi:Raf kinase inhibitor-like YbhB/YbcL family protein